MGREWHTVVSPEDNWKTSRATHNCTVLARLRSSQGFQWMLHHDVSLVERNRFIFLMTLGAVTKCYHDRECVCVLFSAELIKSLSLRLNCQSPSERQICKGDMGRERVDVQKFIWGNVGDISVLSCSSWAHHLRMCWVWEYRAWGQQVAQSLQTLSSC